MTVELTCPYCHFTKKVLKAKIPSGAKWATCPRCRQRFEFYLPELHIGSGIQETDTMARSQGAANEPETDSRRKGAPWEHRSELGLWSGIYQTFKAVLFSPETLFRTLAFTDGIREPLAFGLLIGSLGAMFGVFWQFLIWSGGLSLLGDYFIGQYAIGLVFLIIMALVPAVVTVAMFIHSGILHMFLLLVRGGDNRFEATFRVVSYSQAAQAWSLVPFVGGWIGGVWQLIVQVIGLREMHETSYLRVIVAFLIPVGIFILLVIATLIPLLTFITR